MARMDCVEGGPKVEPKATRFGAMLVTPVDEQGHPYPPAAAPSGTPQLGGILKRLTAMLALLPARLGRTGAQDSLSVTTASDEIAADRAVVRRVTGDNAEVVAMRPNAARRRFYIFNESRHRLYVRFGLGCTWQSFTMALAPGQLYESKGYPVFTGTVTLYGRDIDAHVTEL